MRNLMSDITRQRDGKEEGNEDLQVEIDIEEFNTD
jgi:hypothetical protein